jgi:hypothetical protein
MHMAQEIDRPRVLAYVFVALAGLLAGMALGQFGARLGPGQSRIEWPAPQPAHPRSLNP